MRTPGKLIGSAALAAFALAAQSGGVAPGEVRIHTTEYTSPSARISVEANLVELGVTVRDRNGRPAGGFHAADFELLDNGKPRDISFFSEQRAVRAAAAPTESTVSGNPQAPAAPPQSPAPPKRNVALFFDDVHTGALALRQSRLAAEKLVSGRAQSGYRFAIFTDSGSVEVDFTSDTAALLAGLARLRPHIPPAARGLSVCPTLTPYQAYVIKQGLDEMAKSIAVAEAVECNCYQAGPDCPPLQVGKVEQTAEAVWNSSKYQSTDALLALKNSINVLAVQPGTRILILVSAGFIVGGMEKEFGAVVNAALRSHVVVNSLNAEGLMAVGESPEAFDKSDPARSNWANRTTGMSDRERILSEVLSTAAAATGGQFIHHTNDWGLEKLAEEPEVSYLMGFAPHEEPDGKYHKLKVRLKSAGDYQLAARAGYFSEAPAPATESPQAQIDREVASNSAVPGFVSGLQVSTERASDGRMTIKVVIGVDATRLTFGNREDRSLQQLTFVTVLQDTNGAYVAGKQSVMDLALTAPTMATLREKGFTATVSFAVPSGNYRVREVAREAIDNHLATSNTQVEAR